MSKKRFSLSVLITTVILAVAVAISVTMMIAMQHFNDQVNAVTKKQALYSHITDIDTKVRSYYGTLDEEQLRSALAAGYVNGLLDPYARFLTTADYKTAQSVRAGQASDAGIVLKANETGKLEIERVKTDSAAHKAGVQVGDVIQTVNGTAVTSADRVSTQQLFDTSTEKIALKVQRADKTVAFELTAYVYATESVTDKMLDGGIGYIRITGFYENTVSQFKAAYSALEADGASSFIFDLRGCEAGGSFTALKQMLSFLMPHSAYATLVKADGTAENLVTESVNERNAPTVTLVNAGTKGEAEIFAGVLQEFQRTTVVGEKTAGKGKVQDFIPVKADNSAMYLTVGEVKLIGGGAIEGVGITPNTEKIMSADKTALIGVMSDSEDDQLQAAIVASGVTVQNTNTTTAQTPVTTTATPATTTTAQ